MAKFSHIYTEFKALEYQYTHGVLAKYPQAKRIMIDDYRDLFNRKNQSWLAQKESQKLILAVQSDKFYYQGSDNCHAFGYDHLYYTSQILNCPFDCAYCYLRGLYNSAYLVCFVNQQDYFDAITDLIADKDKLLLCLSYDTDLIALENRLPSLSGWLSFARENRDLLLEIRTKSSGNAQLRNAPPVDNVVLAWTLSPEIIIDKYERKTASLNRRLSAISSAINNQWKVRICIDPVLYINDWQSHYQDLIQKIFSKLQPERIHDISIGTFRMNRDYFKRLKQLSPELDLLHCLWEEHDEMIGYQSQLAEQMQEHLVKLLAKNIDVSRIHCLSGCNKC